MRTAKVLGFGLGGAAALFALVLMALWLSVNPNRYKGKIAAIVKDATGRDLVLDGDLKLSVFPWVALQLGPARLGSPAGFGDAPFVSLQHAAVRARLLPLLQQRLEISHVDIDGLDVHLEKNAAGRGNWEGIGRADDGPAAGSSRPARMSALDGLAGIRITHARVTYEKLTLENFTLETAPFAAGVVPLSIHFDANRGIPTEQASVDAKLDVSNPADRHYRFAAVMLMGQASLAGEDRPLHWHLSSPAVDLDLDAQTVIAPALDVALAGAHMTGSLQATQILGERTVAGSVTLAPVVLREFMPRWGMAGPDTRDPRAFAQASGSAEFAYGGNALRLDALRLTVDDTHIQGNVAVENLETRALKFELAADHIDVNRYLPPDGEAAEGSVEKGELLNKAGMGARDRAAEKRGVMGQAGAMEKPGALGQAGVAEKPGMVEKPAVPADEESPPLTADGTLAIGSVHWSRLDLKDLKLTLAAQDGVARVFPLEAQLDGGRYSGDITLDSRGRVPTLSVDEHLSGVDVAKLSAENGKSGHLSGRGNVTLKASGHGATADGILRTLDGHLDAEVIDGALEGTDIGYELARGEALIRLQSAPAAPDTHRTRFDAFKMSADIVNGLAQTHDLTISSSALRVTGQGSLNLVSQALDLHLLADTLKSTQGVPIQLPVKVTGTTSDPDIRPDLEALAKGQLRQKLKDVLHDKLQSLFGKP